MYRIDDPSASPTLPTPEAALTEGYWTEGNPGDGTPATLERASWFNMIQEELRAIVVAAGLTPSKTTYNQVLTAIRSMLGVQAPGRYLGTQIITASGTYTPGVYNGVTAQTSRVRGTGAGGAGGGCPATASNTIGMATGGCSGAYAEFITPAVPTAVTVGAAGAAGAAGAPGGAGGNSAWGALVTLQGGTGGSIVGPVVPPYVAVSSFAAAVGGTLKPIVSINGNNGSAAIAQSLTVFIASSGGTNPLGAYGEQSQTGPGIPATGFGAGGGGASNAASSAARQGGEGAPGVFIVDEFA